MGKVAQKGNILTYFHVFFLFIVTKNLINPSLGLLKLKIHRGLACSEF